MILIYYIFCINIRHIFVLNIFEFLIALFLIIIALLMLFKKVKRNAKVNGIITKSNCTEKTYTDNKNTTKYYSCNIQYHILLSPSQFG